MATEKIVFETEVKTGNSATSVKSVKAELRQLKAEMAGLEIGSAEFTKMAQRAGQLEDAIGDANAAVKAFNPEAKFQAFAGVLGGVANGFSAAQGAMALFGSESEDINKIMMQTQGAIALATGVNGLLGMKDAFIILGNVIKTQVVSAFATMRAAIMSTGIIALVAVIGTLIYSWMQEKEANEEATKELKRFGEENKRIQDEVTNTAISAMKGRQKEQTELQRKFNDRIAELYKDENKTIREKNAIALELNKQLEIEQQALKDKYREEDLKKQKEKAEKEKELREKNQKSNDEYAKLADERFTKDMYAQIETQKTMNELTSQLERKEFEDSMKRYDAIQAANKAAMELDKAKKDAQLNNLMEVSDALSGFAALAGEQTAAGKAIAVAQTTIDTYVAAQKAYTSQLVPGDPTGPVRGIFFAAAAVASGIANVRRILAVQVPGGGGGGSVPSAGGQSVPQFNPAVAQQVQGGGDITLGQKPQRVYVVESDIRGTMNKVDVIEANATIG
jgi:hypothetical protein